MDGGSSVQNTRQYLAALIATGSAFSGGMAFSWTSPIEAQIVRDSKGQCDYRFCVSQVEFAWMAGCMTIGSLVFALVAGPLMSCIGRKLALLVYFSMVIAGWVCLTFPVAVWTLYIGRLCVGAGYAGCAVIVPIYVGEIAQVSVRGRLISFFEINFQSGILSTYVLGYFFGMFMQSCITLVTISCLGMALFFLPESPRYFVAKNRLEDAEKSLRWLRGKDWNVEAEIKEMKVWQDNFKRQGFGALLSEKANRKALVIVFGVRAGLQLSGITVILFYTSSIFEDANISLDPNLASVLVGIVVVMASFISSYVVDKTGRRVLLLLSYSTQCLCFVAFGVYFAIQDTHPEAVEAWGFAPIVIMCLFVFMNSIGTQPVAFVMMGEVFAQNIKDAAAALSMTWNFSLTIFVVLLFPFLRENFNTGGTFFVFSGFLLASFFFAFFVIPETRGKSFAEIQLLLSGDEKKKAASKDEI